MTKKKFSVHCELTYTSYLDDIEAETRDEAIEKAQEMLYNHTFKGSIPGIQSNFELVSAEADWADEIK